MLVIPAIDLKGGRCVRLRQGDMHQETVYSHDPVSVAVRWVSEGAQILHLVDLDGALDGEPRNLSHIQAILTSVSVLVQVGGGIRSIETVRAYFGLGIHRIVLGTAVIHDRAIIAQASREFPGRVWIGLDAVRGRLAVQGWTETSDVAVTALLPTFKDYPLGGVIYTDIARDGMLMGPNLSALRDVVACSPVRVIASGGISRLEDLRAIAALGPQIEGAIVGKALYEGKLDLSKALAAARQNSER
jgi:phosphoribosylformimino-5-aminoimidazole carboxamide ribotide isomerase